MMKGVTGKGMEMQECLEQAIALWQVKVAIGVFYRDRAF